MIDRLAFRILEWAAGHADEGRYSPVAILFHWTMAVLALAQLALGWWMGRLPAGGGKLAAYDAHYGLGVLMLLLFLGRAGWRLFAPAVINDADKPGWESRTAVITHWVFYACLLGLPLSGWAMISATGRDQGLTLAGLVDWPLLPMQDIHFRTLWTIEQLAEWTHWGLVVTLLALIPLHAGAALKHHLIDRDDVLHGMAPVIAKPKPRRTRWQRRWRSLEKAVAATASRLWPWRRPGSVSARRHA